MDPHSPPPSPNPDTTQVRSTADSANAFHAPSLAPVDVQKLRDRFPFLSPPAPDHADDIGRLGSYRILRLLGEGGMGVVFQAEDSDLLRSVALKVMKPSTTDNQTARARFLREARSAAAITSDHVVTIHRVDEVDGVPYLAMELLQGQNLDSWLHGRTVSATEVTRVAKGVLRGLMAVHEKGLIHRDIKPGNLWVEAPSGRVKLLDFGLTRGNAEHGITSPGQVVGTPAYMSPEQAGGRPVDARSDLFSVGVVLYRMIAGENPFHRPSVQETLAAVAQLDPPSATTFKHVPEELAALVDRLLTKNPGKRPVSAKAALQVIRKFEQQAHARQTVPAEASPPRPKAVTVVAKPVHLEETAEEFEYVFGGEKKKGTRRVFVLDLGGQQTMPFVRVSKGRFLMGAPDEEEGADNNEKPQHPVEISRDFFMSLHPVTQGQYQAIIGELPGKFRGEQLPVESASWEDAITFCERVSDRTQRKIELPTEAEWEYACRAGTNTPFHFGDTLNGELANCDGNSPYGVTGEGPWRRTTVPVGSYPANPWGLHEMHGNVWEWCLDYFGPYDKVKGPNDPVQLARQTEDCRVLRGGSWACEAVMCRAAARIRISPKYRGYSYGFRVCFHLDP